MQGHNCPWQGGALLALTVHVGAMGTLPEPCLPQQRCDAGQVAGQVLAEQCIQQFALEDSGSRQAQPSVVHQTNAYFYILLFPIFCSVFLYSIFFRVPG